MWTDRRLWVGCWLGGLACGTPGDPTPFEAVPERMEPVPLALPCAMEVVERTAYPGPVTAVASTERGLAVGWAGDAPGVALAGQRYTLPAAPTALLGTGSELWVATDGRGVWRVRGGIEAAGLADERVVDLVAADEPLALASSGLIVGLRSGRVRTLDRPAVGLAWLDGVRVAHELGSVAAEADGWEPVPLPAALARGRKPRVGSKLLSTAEVTWIPLPDLGVGRWPADGPVEVFRFWPGSVDAVADRGGLVLAMLEAGVGRLDADGALVGRCPLPVREPAVRLAAFGGDLHVAAGSEVIRLSPLGEPLDAE